ncbi:hypothetical protein BJ986_001284 [Phycicoccus badiiscoriae]|uniref:Uncharacterized protein n=1 Tax=Pedococcus badiiscoriae TaxID=642776 RepID=A0A852WBX5_9MICO|nr:hypothetical protein [Pedococcus badiiscoriae]NYG06797.1 hypothetical protein [Pedococcus badiiscoriae]
MRFPSKAVSVLAAGAAVCAPLAVALASPASATSGPDSTTLSVVSPSNASAQNWAPMAYNCDNGADLTPFQSFELTPKAPLGQGALFFNIGASINQTELYRNTSLDGTNLSALSALKYSTMTPAGKQPAYLRLTVDRDGTQANIDSLYFEPALNPTQGAVVAGEWQTWSAGPGSNWTTDGGPSGVTALADYITANPDAKIYNNGYGGGLSLIAGCGGDTQTNAKLGIDRVVATSAGQTSLWDFEPEAGSPTNSSVVVKDANGSWNASAYNYGGNSGAGSATYIAQKFVLGPKTPVLGKGSRQMTVWDNSDATQFWRTTAVDGKKVDTIRGLGYSTFEEHMAGKAGSALQQPAYLRLSIDSDGPDATTGDIVKDTTLNFEPANNSDQGAVQNGTWQSWDAYNGLFRVVEGPDDNAGQLVTLASFMAHHPDAVFATNAKDFGGSGALSLVVGSGGDNQRNGTFAVDKVNVGLSTVNAGKPSVSTTTYDFEPTYTVPTANSLTRVGAGNVLLTGTAAPGNSVEIRLLKNGTFATLAGTATTDSYGKWSYTLPVSQITSYRAYLADTYGTTDIASATATASVRFLPTLTLSTAKGFTYGKLLLNPSASNVPVRYETYVNHKWVSFARTVSKNGVAALSWDTAKGRTYLVRAYVSSTPTVLGNYSAVQTIKSS